MRVLVLCDDRYHPASTVRSGIGELANAGFEFDWIENGNEWTAERMAAYPVVILTKSNDVSATDHRPWVDDAVQLAFRDHVRRGNGLFVIHSGSASYHDMPVLRELMGGAFVQHPPQCLVTIGPRADHSLTDGCTPFTVMDEHYFMEYDEAHVDPFLTTTSEHGVQIGGWTRVEEKGRVCVLTPGHNVPVWQHPSFQTLIRNGLRWCGNIGL